MIGRVILLGIICMFTNQLAQAQHELLLTDIQIAAAGERFGKYADKTANLASDLPATVLLYKDNHLSYYACFELVQRGKKMKLRMQDYVVYDGNEHRGEKTVVKRKMKSKVLDRIAGVSEQKIVYNDALELAISVIYRYEVLF